MAFVDVTPEKGLIELASPAATLLPLLSKRPPPKGVPFTEALPATGAKRTALGLRLRAAPAVNVPPTLAAPVLADLPRWPLLPWLLGGVADGSSGVECSLAGGTTRIRWCVDAPCDEEEGSCVVVVVAGKARSVPEDDGGGATRWMPMLFAVNGPSEDDDADGASATSGWLESPGTVDDAGPPLLVGKAICDPFITGLDGIAVALYGNVSELLMQPGERSPAAAAFEGVVAVSPSMVVLLLLPTAAG